MADDYNINYSNGTNFLVPSPSGETRHGLSFPGRYSVNYGQAIAQNFLKLVENFARNTAPGSQPGEGQPTEGQLWYNTSPGVDQLKIYDGTNFVPAGGIHKGTNQPDAGLSVVGDLWVDTDNQQLYLFTGSGWVLVGPEFSQGLSTGSKPLSVVGTDNLTYNVVLLEVDAKPAGIISSKTFTPKATIQGFSTIQPGFNLSSADITGSGVGKYYGVAEKSERLIVNGEGIQGINFMRKDASNVANFGLKINNNAGVDVGNSATLNIGVEGQAGVINHKTSGANIDFRVNNQGTTATVVRIDSTAKVGINNTAPAEALDVTGNIQSSGSLRVNSTQQSAGTSTGSMVTYGGLGVAKQLHVGEDSFMKDITVGNILPNAVGKDIGSAGNVFGSVYANNFNGNFTGTFTGSITGNAQSANKLASATNFSLSGDVTSNTITFDGQNDDPAVFNTTVSNSFIASKTSTSFTQPSDEVLINRPIGATGLYKINLTSFFSSIPQLPPGMIMPYAGALPPLNWLLCDGAEHSQSTYTELYQIIGNIYGAAGPGLFRVPDLRGRFPLGKDNMGGTGANNVTAGQADTLGAFSGDDEKTIAVANLPQHTHDLRGLSGTQYYATLDGAIPPGDTATIAVDAPTATLAGAGLPNAGNVVSGTIGQAMDVMNPYLTLNYCIFTGQS